MIIGGSASQKLAALIAKKLGETLCPLETRKFPDGERYVRIGDNIGQDAVVIQSTGYPQDQNLMELFFILKTLNGLDVENIKVVIPYFGYGRQEKRFKSGEAISAQIVAELLESCGASEVLSINLHEDGLRDLFNIPVHNLSAMPPIAEYIRENFNDPVIIAPDKGAAGFAGEIASILDCDYDYLEKTRISPEKVETQIKKLDVQGRETVIIDDIISTGGTIINASNMLRQHGATKIVVSCVHPVLVEDALLRIFATGVDNVIATDTLQSDASTISVASLIADFIKE